MTQEPEPTAAPPALPALKVVEPEVDAGNPWGDDVLERERIARRLMAVVREQDAPFVMSIDGRWGTGKTFLLKRWAQDLQNQRFEAIYFNAWEDDFNDDPLLAIIGQLSEYFDEGPLREIARGVAGALGHVLVKRVTGASPDDLTPDSLLNDYREGLRTKSAVKDRLEQLGEKVRDDTGQPMVFIIDELDRCRPTFAIELLERVKHIFDVPNIVFVFGINRSELMKSLESVYGEIDSGTYLRRFFDMEFILPDADPRRFCTHLLSQYRLPELFSRLGTSLGTSRSSEIEAIAESFPILLGKMGLSLRDIDYCCRLLSLAAMDLPARYPLQVRLFLVLVALKVKQPALYRRFVERSARGADVIDYLNGLTPAGVGVPESEQAWAADQLERMQAAIYAADDAEAVARQFERLRTGSTPDRPEYLSQEHARLGPDDSASMTRISGEIERYAEESRTYGSSLGYHAELVDLYSGEVRR